MLLILRKQPTLLKKKFQTVTKISINVDTLLKIIVVLNHIQLCFARNLNIYRVFNHCDSYDEKMITGILALVLKTQPMLTCVHNKTAYR